MAKLIDGGIKRGRGRKPAIEIGDRYGMLTVTARVEAEGRPRYTCVCDCGCVVTVFGGALLSGNTRSCGCLRRERMRAAGKMASIYARGGDDAGDGH